MPSPFRKRQTPITQRMVPLRRGTPSGGSHPVVFVQPPPKNDSDPSHVLPYLARYMTGGPISDRRLLRWDGDHITFAARSRDKSGRQKPVTLTAREFIRRWSLHILPAGFMKSRTYGGWSNTQRHDYRAVCQSLAPSVVPPGTCSMEVSAQR